MKFSIVIPTWEQHGYGKIYLKELLDTIRLQTFKDFEVLISDHSLNDDIQDLLKNYIDLNILYFKNKNKRGNSPYNTNNGLKRANGEIIKIMFQDDLMFSSNCLEIINIKFYDNFCEWVVNGCNHTLDGINFNRPMIPSWNDQILFGKNTISSPSVLSFKNKNIEFFDENLTMLMDCEYYYKLFKNYGEPCIISDTLISNRIHKNQISSLYNKNINDEVLYVKNKYKIINNTY